MWELDCEESWGPKKWCFWTVVLQKTLEGPLDARRSNQSILKEISPGCSLEGMMLKLKLQYFGYLIRRVDSLEKTLMLEGLGAGGEGDDRGWDGWMASLDRHEFGPTLGVGNGQGGLACCDSWGCKGSDMTKRLNWTFKMTLRWSIHIPVYLDIVAFPSITETPLTPKFYTVFWNISCYSYFYLDTNF